MDCHTQDEFPPETKSTLNSRKKRSPNKLVKNEKEGVRANVQRGRLPLNWNTFRETQQRTTSPFIAKRYNKKSKIVPTQNACLGNHVDMPVNTGNKKVVSSGRCVAIDCEMVGVGDGKENMLARVSMVDENGTVVYDTFVKPQQRVVDYRTAVSGVRPMDMANGKDFGIVQLEVFDLMKGKLLVGHAVRNDLKVLYLSHPKHSIRDTSKFKSFRDEAEGRTPSLRLLAMKLLGLQIQQGEHSSIEDARAAMGLYMRYRNSWESELRSKWHKNTSYKK